MALLFLAHAQLRNLLHPLFVVIGTFAVLAVENLIFAGSVAMYPLRASGLGAVILGLSALAAGVVAAALAFPPHDPTRPGPAALQIDSRGAYLLALILFAGFLLSTAWYWGDVSSRLGLATVIRNPLRLKAAELGGAINSNSLKYFFRGSLLVPVALTIAVYRNPGTWLPKLMLITYLMMSLVQVRRDPIVLSLAAALGTASILEPNKRRLLIPLAIGFGGLLCICGALMVVLNNQRIPVAVTLFGYTAGNLSSFQAILDGYYPPSVSQPGERTWYFLYSLLKYFDRALTPSSVLKPNPFQPLVPNTYTFFSDFYLDFGVAGLVICPLLIGVLMALSYRLAIRKPTLVTLSLFAVVYGDSAMSFMNNEWSWLTIPFTVLYAWLAGTLLLPLVTGMGQVLRLRTWPRAPSASVG